MAFGPAREARQALAQARTDLHKGTWVEPTRATFGEYLDEWISRQMRLRPTTLERNRSLIERHIKPRLGNITLQALAPAHIADFYGHLLTNGRCDGNGGLSEKSVVSIHGVIHKALSDAVKLERVYRNVAAVVDKPK